MAEFRIAEHFVSINGEAAHAGELALFIRFTGCNLQCSYCDTAWANSPDAPHTIFTTQQLVEIVRASGVRNITLTGGEPLLQPDLPEILQALHPLHVRVEIETNGSQSIAAYADSPDRPVFTLDYKCPSSGMEEFMLTENYKYLDSHDSVKFVVGSWEDLEKARGIITAYSLTERCHVFFSPVFGKIDPKEIVAFMQEHKMNGVRMQLQMHKLIWHPEERGV